MPNSTNTSVSNVTGASVTIDSPAIPDFATAQAPHNLNAGGVGKPKKEAKPAAPKTANHLAFQAEIEIKSAIEKGMLVGYSKLSEQSRTKVQKHFEEYLKEAVQIEIAQKNEEEKAAAKKKNNFKLQKNLSQLGIVFRHANNNIDDLVYLAKTFGMLRGLNYKHDLSSLSEYDQADHLYTLARTLSRDPIKADQFLRPVMEELAKRREAGLSEYEERKILTQGARNARAIRLAREAAKLGEDGMTSEQEVTPELIDKAVELAELQGVLPSGLEPDEFSFREPATAEMTAYMRVQAYKDFFKKNPQDLLLKELLNRLERHESVIRSPDIKKHLNFREFIHEKVELAVKHGILSTDQELVEGGNVQLKFIPSARSNKPYGEKEKNRDYDLINSAAYMFHSFGEDDARVKSLVEAVDKAEIEAALKNEKQKTEVKKDTKTKEFTSKVKEVIETKVYDIGEIRAVYLKSMTDIDPNILIDSFTNFFVSMAKTEEDQKVVLDSLKSLKEGSAIQFLDVGHPNLKKENGKVLPVSLSKNGEILIPWSYVAVKGKSGVLKDVDIGIVGQSHPSSDEEVLKIFKQRMKSSEKTASSTNYPTTNEELAAAAQDIAATATNLGRGLGHAFRQLTDYIGLTTPETEVKPKSGAQLKNNGKEKEREDL